jgi:hypothetical protein
VENKNIADAARCRKTRQNVMFEQTLATRNASKDGKCSQGKIQAFLEEGNRSSSVFQHC